MYKNIFTTHQTRYVDARGRVLAHCQRSRDISREPGAIYTRSSERESAIPLLNNSRRTRRKRRERIITRASDLINYYVFAVSKEREMRVL